MLVASPARPLAFEMAAAEMSVGLLVGDKDASWVFYRVAALALVDIGALDRIAGEFLRGLDNVAERVAIDKTIALLKLAWNQNATSASQGD